MRSLAVVCIFLASLPIATAQMSHEETVVRTAYARFAYAVQQEAIGELAVEAQNGGASTPKRYAGLTSDQRLADAQVNFTLSDFVVGDIHEIMQEKLYDLITSNVGEELATESVTQSFNDRGLATGWNGLGAYWQTVEPVSSEAAKLTIGQVFQLQWDKDKPNTTWQRYASYSAMVSYQGKSRGPYKALFIFGRDEKGNEVIQPNDIAVSVTGLAYALAKPLFPEAFVTTRLRRFPVVSNWLNANLVSRPRCSVGMGDVCCDLVRLKCGPEKDDVAAGLAKPEPGGGK